jgi:hypothetical protein
MEPITPEEIKNTSDISIETKQSFINNVIATFETFYTGDDVQQQIEVMRSFGDDATAVINFAYGALLASNIDISKFVEATRVLAAQSDEE